MKRCCFVLALVLLAFVSCGTKFGVVAFNQTEFHRQRSLWEAQKIGKYRYRYDYTSTNGYGSHVAYELTVAGNTLTGIKVIAGEFPQGLASDEVFDPDSPEDLATLQKKAYTPLTISDTFPSIEQWYKQSKEEIESHGEERIVYAIDYDPVFHFPRSVKVHVEYDPNNHGTIWGGGGYDTTTLSGFELIP
jgi:hypothetical protein